MEKSEYTSTIVFKLYLQYIICLLILSFYQLLTWVSHLRTAMWRCLWIARKRLLWPSARMWLLLSSASPSNTSTPLWSIHSASIKCVKKILLKKRNSFSKAKRKISECVLCRSHILLCFILSFHTVCTLILKLLFKGDITLKESVFLYTFSKSCNLLWAFLLPVTLDVQFACLLANYSEML